MAGNRQSRTNRFRTRYSYNTGRASRSASGFRTTRTGNQSDVAARATGIVTGTAVSAATGRQSDRSAGTANRT